MLTQILYEDKDIIVARKPAGIAVQTARPGQQDVVSELKNYLAHGNGGSGGKGGNGMSGGHGEPYLGIIHRLDQPVEGMLVFAKTKTGAASLTKQLLKQNDESAFCKRYYAVLCGIPAHREGRLTDYLYKQAVKNGKHMDYRAVIEKLNPGNQDCCARQDGGDCGDNRDCPDQPGGDGAGDKSRVSASDFADRSRFGGKQKGQKACSGAVQKPKARRAELEYRILEVQEHQGLALADIAILTGRFHQIRAQMAHAGMPLLGDLKYGTQDTKTLALRLGVRNVALCACQLGFIHPVSGERMDFRIKPDNPAFSSFSQL